MIWWLWSPKGGCGTTTVAAMTALVFAEQAPTTLIDPSGDASVMLGLGISGAGDRRPDRSISRPVTERLTVLEPNDTTDSLDGADALFEVAAGIAAAGGVGAMVVVDGGRRAAPAGADRSVQVLRPCYLALARATQAARPDAVVLITEPARALQVRDVESVIGMPVTVTLGLDRAVARWIDVGLLAQHTPWAARVLRPLTTTSNTTT